MKPEERNTVTQRANAVGDDRDSDDAQRTRLPNEWQCALLIVLLIQTRQEELKSRRMGRNITRARISQNTIRKLCLRSQLSSEFLLAIQEHLLAAGWALFCIGPTHYAVIKVASTQGWGRISSKRIEEELGQVARGTFVWRDHEQLLLAGGDDADSEGEGEEPETEE
jgi:hypothetical protein